MRLENMLPGDVQQAVAAGRTLLLPCGCLEYHGPHLPLGCDAIMAQEAALAVAPAVGAVVAPALFYGPTGYAVTGPREGTVDVNTERFGRHAKDILLSFYRMGWKRIVMLQWHQGTEGPEALALRQAAAEITFEEPLRERGEAWWGEARHRPEENVFGRIVLLSVIQGEAEGVAGGDHAGEFETSYMLYLRPEACDLARLDPEEYFFLKQAPLGTAERGRLMFEAIVRGLTTKLRELAEG